MSKHRPDSDRLANELAGASAFFKRSSAQPTDPEPTPTPPVAPLSTTPTVPVREIEQERPARTPRTPVRPARRQMIRHPFELYMDQLDSLRDLADAQRRRGEPGSMSRMVREAIDRYLDEHKAED
jgi:hypothetical protein